MTAQGEPRAGLLEFDLEISSCGLPAGVCCNVLQCGAVWCSALHWCCGLIMRSLLAASLLVCVAVCCSMLQCGAVCWSVVQCVGVWCSVVHCVAVCCSVLQHVMQCVVVCCGLPSCGLLTGLRHVTRT